MENNRLTFDFNDGVLRVTIVGEINHHSAVFVRQEIDEKIQEWAVMPRPGKAVRHMTRAISMAATLLKVVNFID